jgi:hypothetical protein
MSRFGDFMLLEELGRSASSDRYKAMHATQGGPFLLKVYRRLDPSLRGAWRTRHTFRQRHHHQRSSSQRKQDNDSTQHQACPNQSSPYQFSQPSHN